MTMIVCRRMDCMYNRKERCKCTTIGLDDKGCDTYLDTISVKAPVCAGCGVSVLKSHLHRSNPKGEKAIWKCESCLDAPITTERRELLDAITGR